MTEPIHIISLGAGVQSSTIALKAVCGEITPMPVFGLFADTGDEPSEVYKWLSELKGLLPFPVETCSAGRLSENLVQYGHSQLPAFTAGGGMGKRQCTTKFKIEPMHRHLKARLGIARKRNPPLSCILWMGISADEVSRAKDARDGWLQHRFPLLELSMSRRDCLTWLNQHHYPTPPKSACVFCPYRTRAQWRVSKAKHGTEWELILKVSRELAARAEYLTQDCKPIEDVDFSTEEERGQLNMFNEECSGLCGV